MANNNITCHKIFGDEKEISQLYEKLTKLQQINNTHWQQWCKAKQAGEPLPDFPSEITENTPHLWLGDIITHFGGDNTKVECKGTMDFLDLHSDTLIWVVTDTAWHAMPEVWDIVIKDYPSVKFHYLSEEHGHQIYINSDPTGEYFPEQYYIYNPNRGEETYGYCDTSLFAEIADAIDVEEINSFEQMDKLLEQYNKENPDAPISYHKFKPPTEK